MSVATSHLDASPSKFSPGLSIPRLFDFDVFLGAGRGLARGGGFNRAFGD